MIWAIKETMQNILNKNNEQKEQPKENQPRVVVASKLKITREKIDKYGNVISRTER